MSDVTGVRARRGASTVLVVIAGLGLLLRWGIAMRSVGSTDALIWEHFATSAARSGLPAAYLQEDGEHGVTVLNHPPLPVLWAIASLRIAQATRVSFAFMFKLPMLLAEMGAVFLLLRRRGPRSHAAAVGYAWSVCAILVSAYHCNTDGVCAALLLAAALTLEEQRTRLAGGLLGLAINVKLVPVLAIPACLVAISSWRVRRSFLTSLAPWALPFAILTALSGPAFLRRLLGYRPISNLWGIEAFLSPGVGQGRLGPLFASLGHAWSRGGEWVMFAAVLAAAWLSRRGGHGAVQAVFLAIGTFLLLTPGFGVQYTILVLPLFFAHDLGRAALYGTLAGLFIGISYIDFWNGQTPWVSLFAGPYPPPAPAFGIAAWCALLAGLAHAIRPVRLRGHAL